jgi:hypothetical protein
MRTFFRCLTLLTWALWFGGVMGLFLSVQVLFHQTDRSVFLASAPRLFIAFERYQLVLAATTLLATIAWRTIERSPQLTTLFVLFAIATVGAVIETTQITPRIEALRIAGETHTPQFLRLHGMSMAVYLTVAIMLLIAGVMLSLHLAAGPARRARRLETASRLAG